MQSSKTGWINKRAAAQHMTVLLAGSRASRVPRAQQAQPEPGDGFGVGWGRPPGLRWA